MIKQRAVDEANKQTDFESLEDELLFQWYFVGKTFGKVLPATFGYFTMEALLREIVKEAEEMKRRTEENG